MKKKHSVLRVCAGSSLVFMNELVSKKGGITFLFFLLSSISNVSFASNFQNFTGINYTNPADLTVLVKDTTVLFGYDLLVPAIHYNGTITVPDPFGVNNVVTNGRSTIDNNYDLPYGRMAKRLTPQLVIGLDITTPFKTVVKYDSTSNARYATINTTLSSVDYAPNIAYQFKGMLDKLSVGFGLDFLQVWAALDKMYPALTLPFGAGPDNRVTNHASSWTYGWHAGLLYQLLEGTFLELSYFSATTPRVEGHSSFTDFPSTKNLSAKIHLPATTTFAATQFLSETWFVRLQFHYTQWNTLRQITLNNTAGPAPTSLVNLFYTNTWETDLTSQYYFTPKIYLTGFLSYDQTPTSTPFRTLGLPEVSFYTIAIAPGYKFSKCMSAELHYAHSISARRVPLNTVDPNDGTTTFGNAHVAADIFGFQINYEV